MVMRSCGSMCSKRTRQVRRCPTDVSRPTRVPALSCIARTVERGTVVGMSATSPAKRPIEAPAPYSIDELLRLPREQRLAMLADLRAGRPGPVVIARVPRTVRSLRSDRADQVI